MHVKEEKSEEQALALPCADQETLRSQTCYTKAVVAQLQAELEQISLKLPEPEAKALESGEEQAIALPCAVQDALLSQSCEAKEVVVRLQEEMQLEQASLKNPEPETKKMIRCLAQKAKCSGRLDVVEHLREVVPAGTTGTN